MTTDDPISQPGRLRAVARALKLLYSISRRDSLFREYGGHLLLAFALIGTTSRSRALSRLAIEMGRERAGHWIRRWARLRRHLDADTVLQEVIASDAAQRLGMTASHISRNLRATIARCSTPALLYFDPATEDAPDDIPEDCACGCANARGRRTCARCRRRLRARSRYEVWYYALTNAYFCERQAMPLRVRVADLLLQLPTLRPYPKPGTPDHYQSIYAVTHLVYVLNDYGRSRLLPLPLSRELKFLKESMQWALDRREPDTVGEVIDSLLALGVSDTHRLVVAGRRFLIETQEADSGWGDKNDPYGRFHTVWTAMDGLRDYRWRGRRIHDPAMSLR
jgi:hypothetical protein